MQRRSKAPSTRIRISHIFFPICLLIFSHTFNKHEYFNKKAIHRLNIQRKQKKLKTKYKIIYNTKVAKQDIMCADFFLLESVDVGFLKKQGKRRIQINAFSELLFSIFL